MTVVLGFLTALAAIIGLLVKVLRVDPEGEAVHGLTIVLVVLSTGLGIYLLALLSYIAS